MVQAQIKPGNVLYAFRPGQQAPAGALLADEARGGDLTARGAKGKPARFQAVGNGLWRGPGGLWRLEVAPDEPDDETLAAWTALANSRPSGR
ncbi:hypothetical protein [Caldinitratiruptor microaerophilus]|uniref:Uncharacterized protein n=1 Tax=Caldinitratiruptor microaerophilus TaxID=671077 RepID=A0AA35CK17_9FIRM|nr:hypothetical protein [Caldinitratiruptor microaerophilus]BDG59919.1 hypothetical protein caldi_10090 [Caldinitratiruptor microaerophilus]